MITLLNFRTKKAIWMKEMGGESRIVDSLDIYFQLDGEQVIPRLSLKTHKYITGLQCISFWRGRLDFFVSRNLKGLWDQEDK